MEEYVDLRALLGIYFGSIPLNYLDASPRKDKKKKKRISVLKLNGTQ